MVLKSISKHLLLIERLDIFVNPLPKGLKEELRKYHLDAAKDSLFYLWGEEEAVVYIIGEICSSLGITYEGRRVLYEDETQVWYLLVTIPKK